MLWRRHSDAINQALLARWLPKTRVTRLLKTDLFDEAVSGGFAELLQSHSALVVGIDVSPGIARQAKSRTSDLHPVIADVRHLPFADDAFDVVVSLSTLDHFHTQEELTASLHELSRVLRNGGSLILTMDNPRNPLIALRNALPFALLHRLGIVPYYVGVTYGQHKLRTLLARTGCRVVELRPVLHCLRVLAVPAGRLVHRFAGENVQRGLLRLLQMFEGLSRAPTRFFTGHYVAVLAEKITS